MNMPDPDNTESTARDETPGGVFLNGLACRCPRCRKGHLFKGYATIVGKCPVCGLGFEGHDVGDGPVVPMMLVIGALVVGLSLYVEFTFLPPVWVHVVLWTPLVVGLTLIMLKRSKSIAIQLQYRYRSTEKETRPGGQ